MNGKTLTTSVEIQMSLIYGKGKTVVPVKILKVQQQNLIDYGVFAIAFMVEFCFNNFIGRDNVNFDTYTMHDHLIKCIESQQFSPFPKTKPTRTKVLSLLLMYWSMSLQNFKNFKEEIKVQSLINWKFQLGPGYNF